MRDRSYDKRTYTHIRIRKSTKRLIDRWRQERLDAYEQGRSPKPIKNPDIGVTTDEFIHEAIEFYVSERLRKNAAKKTNKKQVGHGPHPLTVQVGKAS